MSNNTNDPNTSSSALSKKARLAHWITGGTKRGPSTMSSFTRMTRDRNDVKKATKAWAVAGERGLDDHHGRWGRSGLPGALDQARGAGPRPRGTALIRWFREGGGGGGHGGNPADAAGQPEMQQEGRQGQGQGPGQAEAEAEAGPAEDDIYGSGDDTMGSRAEGGNNRDGGTTAETATGDRVGQQAGEGGDDQHQEGAARPS